MIRHHQGAQAMVADFATAGAGQEAEIFRFASEVDADQGSKSRACADAASLTSFRMKTRQHLSNRSTTSEMGSEPMAWIGREMDARAGIAPASGGHVVFHGHPGGGADEWPRRQLH